jgi:hypothetical protein
VKGISEASAKDRGRLDYLAHHPADEQHGHCEVDGIARSSASALDPLVTEFA